jgi:hypothetical protein
MTTEKEAHRCKMVTQLFVGDHMAAVGKVCNTALPSRLLPARLCLAAIILLVTRNIIRRATSGVVQVMRAMLKQRCVE